MEELVKKISRKIQAYSQNQIKITPYCYGRMKERNIEETLLISTLFSTENLYYVREQLKIHQGQTEKRHKLIFKISSKYSLIIILRLYPKVLKIINTIKTSKEVEKKWRNKKLK